MPASVEKLLNSQYVQLALAALAFLIALWFVVVIARMLMGGRLRLPGGRTRQARLGIVDAFDLDRQRQLIIVRRDNTEHLIMIGGPNDLLIESEIVRVESRDGRRDKGEGEPRLDGRPAPRLGLEAPANGAPNGLQRPEDFAGIGSAPQPYAAPVGFDEEDEAQRPPTFPLPPRRPVAPPLPERRPAPDRLRPVEPALLDMPPMPAAAPPQAAPQGLPAAQGTAQSNPQGIAQGAVQGTGTDEPAMVEPQFSPPLPPSAAPVDAAPPVAPVPPRPMPPVLGPADRPLPTRPSPFLKPLPPRPPLRPLKRVTPQAPPATPAAQDADRAPAEQPAEAPRPVAPPSAPPVAPEPAPVEPTERKDGLESLEEEMAKLLGR